MRDGKHMSDNSDNSDNEAAMASAQVPPDDGWQHIGQLADRMRRHKRDCFPPQQPARVLPKPRVAGNSRPDVSAYAQ